MRVITIPIGGRAFFVFAKEENMRLTVNGKQLFAPEGLNIAELITDQGFNSQIIVIEYNGRVIKREDWQTIILQQEDCLEVVSFVGGG